MSSHLPQLPSSSSSVVVVDDDFKRVVDSNGKLFRCVCPFRKTFRLNAKLRWRGKRLLAILMEEFRFMSKEYCIAAMNAGNIRLRETSCSPDCVIKADDSIEHNTYMFEFLCNADPIAVLYEDAEILAAAKPSGMPCYPTGMYQHLSLTEILKAFHLNNSNGYLHPLHRLDRVTSGLLLLAKTRESSRKFTKLMENARKYYIAKVDGDFREVYRRKAWCRERCASVEDSGDVDGVANELTVALDGDWVNCKANLKVSKRSPGLPLKVEVDGVEGRYAETWFRHLQFDGRHSIVLARPITGRTHQIRAHLSLLGFPILNDSLYADGLFDFVGNQNVEAALEFSVTDDDGYPHKNSMYDNVSEVVAEFGLSEFCGRKIDDDEVIEVDVSYVGAAKRRRNARLNADGRQLSDKVDLAQLETLANSNSDLFKNRVHIDHENQRVSITYYVEQPSEICLMSYHYEIVAEQQQTNSSPAQTIVNAASLPSTTDITTADTAKSESAPSYKQETQHFEQPDQQPINATTNAIHSKDGCNPINRPMTFTCTMLPSWLSDSLSSNLLQLLRSSSLISADLSTSIYPEH